MVCVPFFSLFVSLFSDEDDVQRLHFIPLSATYDELYNIHAYFSGPSASMVEAWKNSTGGSLPVPAAAWGDGGEALRYMPKETGLSAKDRDADRFRHLNSEGDRRLRRIAKAGQQWKRKIGRRVDMEGTFYVFFSPPSWYGTLISFLSLCVQTRAGVGPTGRGRSGGYGIHALNEVDNKYGLKLLSFFEISLSLVLFVVVLA